MIGRAAGTVFRDFTLLMVLGFVAMVIWLLPHVSPPAENADAVPPGNVVIAITWPPGDTDIDLWVTGPGEIVPVGYSNKGGLLFNLLRDDLGDRPDATPLNYENTYSRGIIAGEYIVNVHCYRCPVVPQKVDLEISINKGDNSKGVTPVAVTSVKLRANGEEKTALRFRLDPAGNVMPNSMNNVFRPLRAARGGS
ncbi:MULTISPECIES: hypothetical protein [unclassified Ensifer]|uniref:hypothetical protein n=1 Tax=unclassified Ensifer TaxID=2633371 RepID=UPI000813B5F4|nr:MULTISPECIES: hypothetical protein [unclassified Ensifer]OCP19375.1 hypothetical protein BC361_31100 [Ensifer sp. LC54]OCP19499.1 hypothetical protein BC363_31025 [Ensifer sp. LC384]